MVKSWVVDEKGEYVSFEPRRRGGKKQRYTVALNIRITPEMMEKLQEISRFERHRAIAEIIREWINDKIDIYSRNPAFKRFLRVERELRGKEGG